MSFWLQMSLVFIGCFALSWLVQDLSRGKDPRWFEITRFTLANIFHRERQYWRDYDLAKYGHDRLEAIAARFRAIEDADGRE